MPNISTTRQPVRDNVRHGWATCPITENGCLRLMVQPGQPGHPGRLPASAVAERLREATTATEHHRFWPDAVSLLNRRVVEWRRIIGSKQITDIYLLALAVERQGRFATFDARIAPDTVVGAGERHICVV